MANPAESKELKMKSEIARLTKYAEGLKRRLNASVPEKHAKDPQVFKEMIALDLKKTLAKMEKLK